MRGQRSVASLVSSPDFKCTGRSGWVSDWIATFNRGAQVLQSTRDDKGDTASAPKMDEVVCAHNFFKRKGAKPILQATVHLPILL
jgi:hypothetical protein